MFLNSFGGGVAAYSVASDGRTAGQLFPKVRGNVKGFRTWT